MLPMNPMNQKKTHLKSFQMTVGLQPIEVCYYEWTGPPNSRTVVCAHGLTLNGASFDALASALCEHFTVVCPDMPGRGRSTWLLNPLSYNFLTYEKVALALLQHLRESGLDRNVDWIGTSMGGLVGMMLAARPENLIQTLILNDVGPLIYDSSMDRMRSYVGNDRRFESMKELEKYLREIHSGLGPMTEEQWEHFALISAMTLSDGTFKLNYDPQIGLPFEMLNLQQSLQFITSYWLPLFPRFWIPNVDCWRIYDQIKAKTLVLRGALSDVLRSEDALAMKTRGPRADLVEFAGVGHVPALMNEEQIRIVIDFLQK